MNVSLTDLGTHWRIDVQRVWVGTSMDESYAAQLLKRTERGRWNPLGRKVVNDEGPIQAASDLLSALDAGVLQ